MIKYGRALYYPSIEFKNINWFKMSTLFYEGLDRIVPKNLNYYDNKEVRTINDQIGYIKNIDPKEYADRASENYIEYLENNILDLGEKRINEIFSKGDENQFSLHHDKIGYNLITHLSKYIKIEQKNSWYSFSKILGFTYMAFLANEIGKSKNLSVVTDYDKNQIAFNLASLESTVHNEDLSFNLASLAIKSYLPKNIESVSVTQLLNFRKNHEPERIRFYSAINELVSDLNTLKDKRSLDDILNFRKKEIDNSVAELRLSLKGLGIEVYEGILGITLPTALQLLPNEVEYSSYIKGFGVASILVILGAKSFLNKRKIKNNSPYSYLLSLEESALGKERLLNQLMKGKIIV